MAWLAPAIAAIASIASAGVAAAANRKSQREANIYNAEQARLAFERERSSIQEQNAYNTPAAQNTRLLAAGLSPGSAYGYVDAGNQQGFADAGAAAGAHPVDYSSLAGTAAGSISSMMNIELENRNIDNQIEQTRINADLLEETKLNNEVEREYKRAGISNIQADSILKQWQMAVQSALVDETWAKARLAYVQKDYYKSLIGKTSAEVSQIQEMVKQIAATTERLIPAQVAHLYSESALNSAYTTYQSGQNKIFSNFSESQYKSLVDAAFKSSIYNFNSSKYNYLNLKEGLYTKPVDTFNNVLRSGVEIFLLSKAPFLRKSNPIGFK